MSNFVKYKEELRICNGCGIPYQPKTKEQKYCTQKCYLESKGYVITKEVLEAREPKLCANCGESFKPKHGNQGYCSKSCRLKGYINRKGYNLSRVGWASLREFVLERDNYHCQDCGKFLMDIGLEVHHIKFLRERGTNNERNLISLCHKCHKKRHGIVG